MGHGPAGHQAARPPHLAQPATHSPLTPLSTHAPETLAHNRTPPLLPARSPLLPQPPSIRIGLRPWCPAARLAVGVPRHRSSSPASPTPDASRSRRRPARTSPCPSSPSPTRPRPHHLDAVDCRTPLPRRTSSSTSPSSPSSSPKAPPSLADPLLCNAGEATASLSSSSLSVARHRPAPRSPLLDPERALKEICPGGNNKVIIYFLIT